MPELKSAKLIDQQEFYSARPRTFWSPVVHILFHGILNTWEVSGLRGLSSYPNKFNASFEIYLSYVIFIVSLSNYVKCVLHLHVQLHVYGRYHKTTEFNYFYTVPRGKIYGSLSVKKCVKNLINYKKNIEKVVVFNNLY